MIVSSEGELIGEGAHHGPGEDHAEVVAIKDAGQRSHGATMYVTLEPCSHHGRTPPCVDAIETAGLAKVVVGAIDPDSRISGSGIERLRSRGIEVVESGQSEIVRAMDPAYFHHRQSGMPLVTIKYAMTLDGSVAALDGSSQWITSEQARRDVHSLRSEADAVLVGAGTVRTDNPRLDVRLDDYAGQQPRPVVVAGSDALPADVSIWSSDPIVVSTRRMDVPKGQVLVVGGDDNRPDPVETCRALAELGLLHLLVEGGPTIIKSWLDAGVVTNGVVYLGARLGGGRGVSPVSGRFDSIADAQVVSVTAVRSLGEDVRIDFEL